MDSEDADSVQALLAHEEDTAGGLMDIRVAVVHQSVRVARAIDVLREEASDLEVFELFVVVDENHLVGELPGSRLVTTSPSTPIDRVIDTDVISVALDQDQEKIARLFTHYDLRTAPVVDDRGRLVGHDHDPRRGRLPWLLFCLAGSFLSGVAIHWFDATLERAITLAAFIPVIMATGGNNGLQFATVTIRGMMVGQITAGRVARGSSVNWALRLWLA